MLAPFPAQQNNINGFQSGFFIYVQNCIGNFTLPLCIAPLQTPTNVYFYNMLIPEWQSWACRVVWKPNSGSTGTACFFSVSSFHLAFCSHNVAEFLWHIVPVFTWCIDQPSAHTVEIWVQPPYFAYLKAYFSDLYFIFCEVTAYLK